MDLTVTHILVSGDQREDLSHGFKYKLDRHMMWSVGAPIHFMCYGDSLEHITCSRSGEERSPERLKHKAFGLVTNAASFQNTSL